jgi:hemerythrin
MSLFSWKDSYSIGVPDIDAQHRQLYKLADDLHQALNAGQGKDALAAVLKSLIDYTKTHFADEERLMQRYGYSELAAHKAQHEDLTRKVIDLQRQMQADKLMLSIEVMRFLSDWLRQHIGGSDRRYAPFVINRAVA